MNKWFPDIQLRLLDVRFPTFNVTYCTWGSRRVDIAFQKLHTYQVTQTGVPVNATMAPQRYMITVAGSASTMSSHSATGARYHTVTPSLAFIEPLVPVSSESSLDRYRNATLFVNCTSVNRSAVPDTVSFAY